MKRFFVHSSLLFLFCCLWGGSIVAQSQPQLADYGLSGSVKQVSATQSYAKGGDMTFVETYDFDEHGYLVCYRKKGFGNETSVSYPLLDKQVDSLHRVRYDFDGDPVESVDYTADGRVKFSQHYIYAVGGKLAMTIRYEYSPAGTVTSRKLFQYDKQARLSDTYLYTPDEVLLFEEHYSYDKCGSLIKKVQIAYDDEGSVSKSVETRKYVYDKLGNWTQMQCFINSVLMYTTIRTITLY